MANQILLSVDQRHLTVAPGASVALGVTAQNLSTLLDQVAVGVQGIEAQWVQVIPRYLPVFAQGQATAQVVFQPPRDPAQSVAGVYPLRVVGASQEFPGHEGEDKSELEVQLVGDYRLALDKGEARSGQESVFALKVLNGANAFLQLQFKAGDSADELWYKFDPYQLDVPPGGQANAMLTLRAKNKAPAERAIIFDVTAHGEFQPKNSAPLTAPSHQVSGQFVQGAPARLIISIQPPHVEAMDRGAYQVRVGNPGAAPAVVQLSGSDDGNLDFDFQPAQATLPPQSEASISLVVRPRAVLTSAPRQVNAFQVTARPVNGETSPITTQATFAQIGTLPAKPRSYVLVWLLVVAAIIFACLVAMTLIAVFGLGLVR
ncbi:MAG: hypothetical protein HY782_06730 [Chloroflexi bacterium]|nr:hypothetical protein [Chloroflexota bacterium]